MAKTQTPPEQYSSDWLDKLDGRTGIAQAMRERYQNLSDDLGGLSSLSYQQRSLITRSLWLEYWLAQQEKLLATGGDFDAGKWTQGVNALSGLYAKLGLHKQVKEVNIGSFLKANSK